MKNKQFNLKTSEFSRGLVQKSKNNISIPTTVKCYINTVQHFFKNNPMNMFYKRHISLAIAISKYRTIPLNMFYKQHVSLAIAISKSKSIYYTILLYYKYILYIIYNKMYEIAIAQDKAINKKYIIGIFSKTMVLRGV